MKFITIIPFTLWIIVLALAATWYAFGLPGFVIGVIVFTLLHF